MFENPCHRPPVLLAGNEDRANALVPEVTLGLIAFPLEGAVRATPAPAISWWEAGIVLLPLALPPPAERRLVESFEPWGVREGRTITDAVHDLTFKLY